MKRDATLDILRGIGIFLVVFGHILSGNLLQNIIYYFHMPLFFFITGMTFFYSYKEKESFKSFITKKFKSIIIPYLIFSIITFSYWVLIEKRIRGQMDISSINNFLNIFIAKIDGNLYAYNIVMWFLPCLFFSEVVFFFIAKITNKLGKLFISIVSLLIGYLLVCNRIFLPFCLETIFISSFFIVIGYLFMFIIKKFDLLNKATFNNTIILLLCVANIFVCYYLDCYVNMIGHNYGNLFLFLTGSFSGIYICLFISIFAKKKNCKFISFLGKNSLIIMCCHEPIKRIIIKVLSIILNINENILRANIFYSLMVTICVLLTLTPIVFIINKWFPFAIGKKKKE